MSSVGSNVGSREGYGGIRGNIGRRKRERRRRVWVQVSGNVGRR